MTAHSLSIVHQLDNDRTPYSPTCNHEVKARSSPRHSNLRKQPITSRPQINTRTSGDQSGLVYTRTRWKTDHRRRADHVDVRRRLSRGFSPCRRVLTASIATRPGVGRLAIGHTSNGQLHARISAYVPVPQSELLPCQGPAPRRAAR
jgi:hypothetical protein